MFIAREMPLGLAGLIVAGIFAAAQSTVSTSMNSTATAIVTDFMRPANACNSEAGYLRAARLWTFMLGAVGTLLALVFVKPDIKSLFDTFIIVIGLFMGVLGGLFILGARHSTSKRNGGDDRRDCWSQRDVLPVEIHIRERLPLHGMRHQHVRYRGFRRKFRVRPVGQ